MWTTQRNNLLCSYLDAYENQKKHIERVLSAKDTTKSTIPPYYPKFLLLKASKYFMEEEKNDQIKEGNKILYLKIKNVIKKPSKYSKIFEPKKCPAFDKEKLLLKRIKHEINNYQENIRFYHRIEKANSFYPLEDFFKRNKELEENSKILQKSIFDISPNLMFSSPERIKSEIEKYKNKRNNSARPKSRPSSQTVTNKNKKGIFNKNYTMKDNTQNKEEKKTQTHNTNKKENKSEQNNYNKINKRNGNVNKNNSNSKKFSRNTTDSKMSNKNKNNENDKNKRTKSTLKRNESEINLLA